MTKRILIVPGFMADTYSSERWYVELSRTRDNQLDFLWLVPDLGHLLADKRAWSEDSIGLREPIYVTHLREHGIPYVIGNISKLNLFANFLLFLRIFRTHRIDAVYTHFGYERFWATIFGRMWGKETIWNEHWHSLGTRFVAAKRIFYRLFVNHFIAVSGFIARTLPKRARIHTVPNSIPLEDCMIPTDEERHVARHKLGLPTSATIVLMVAAFTKQKRHELALKICYKVLERRPQTLFVFLGDGSERGAITAKISETRLSSNFLLPGHVNNVRDYYIAANLGMFTAYNDAAPLAVLESMKYSLPMVSFASGGPAEYVRPGITGKLVNDGDVDLYTNALIELIDRTEERRQMAENAFRLVHEEYSLSAWVARMRAVLTDIVSGALKAHTMTSSE